MRARGEALNGEYAYTCKSRVSLDYLMIPTLSTGNRAQCKPMTATASVVKDAILEHPDAK